MPVIENVHAREVLDSRGNPTVEVEVETESGTKPDFLAWFGEQGFVVEATSPEFLTKFEHNRRRVGPLNKITWVCTLRP